MLIANGPNLDHEIRRDSGEGTLKCAKMTLTIFRELFRFQSGIQYSFGYLFFSQNSVIVIVQQFAILSKYEM